MVCGVLGDWGKVLGVFVCLGFRYGYNWMLGMAFRLLLMLMVLNVSLVLRVLRLFRRLRFFGGTAGVLYGGCCRWQGCLGS